MKQEPLRELPGRETFPRLSTLRADWSISRERFEAFLTWLDPDRDQAGRKYEDIRLRLIKVFTCRGCLYPEDLADETINRVIVKVQEISSGYQGDPGRYFGGVARNVFREYARRPVVPVVQPKPDPPDARDAEMECLEECLGDIPENNRDLILQYYQGEKGSRIQTRGILARTLGLEPNALRIRVHRIRTVLLQCVIDCLARAA